MVHMKFRNRGVRVRVAGARVRGEFRVAGARFVAGFLGDYGKTAIMERSVRRGSSKNRGCLPTNRKNVLRLIFGTSCVESLVFLGFSQERCFSGAT